MTEKTLDWLNANRFRAYPFVNDAGLLSDGKRIPDCMLLDCLVVDTRQAATAQSLTFTGLTVTTESSTITLTYGSRAFSYTFSGGTTSGEGSFFVVRAPSNTPTPTLHFRLVLSSHAYILEHAGTGRWDFRGRVLPTKIIASAASGVSSLTVHGSEGTFDRGEPGSIKGEIELKDGYRTMPTIQNGRIVVRVGTQYGEDPCHHDWGVHPSEEECAKHLLFFCGQTGSRDGDVALKGGPGVSVTTGRNYVARRDIIDSYGNVGIQAGESIPCIEVSATSELMRIYTPTVLKSSESSSEKGQCSV